MGDIRSIYSDARGLWWENRWRAVAEAAANLVLNFVMGKFFGVPGIVAATLISLFLINFVWGSTIIYKHYFTEIRISEYYLLHLFYVAVTAAACVACWFICSLVPFTGIVGCIIRFVLCAVIPNMVYIASYSKFYEFQIAKRWLLYAVLKKEK